MKDINELKNYREKYKRYYKIDFDNNYVIHHIDFDRKNNDIKNLLLLPFELHQRYHFYLSAMCGSLWKSGKLTLDAKITQFGCLPYANDEYLRGFFDTMSECQKWLQYKNNLDFRKQFESEV